MEGNVYDNLVAALKKANEDAQQAICEDEGTCNLDTLALDYRNMKIQKEQVIAAIERAGFFCSEYKNFLFIYFPMQGCASCRTAMVEAFRDSLRNSGFFCWVYYRID